MWISEKTKYDDFELDELFHFKNKKKGLENYSNLFVMTMISRIPRQIVGFAVEKSVNSDSIQKIVDSVPTAKNYFTDGGRQYLDVYFEGKYHRNIHNKNNTHIIESTNCDLRHYLKLLSRKSRCFPRSFETLRAVLSVFINAYNKFGEAKLNYQIPVIHKQTTKVTNKYHKLRYPYFSISDFLFS